MKIDYFDCNCFVDVAKENLEKAKDYLEQRNVDYVYTIFDNIAEFGCISSKRTEKIFDDLGKRFKFTKPLDKNVKM